jgi:hypothetical protein
MCYTYATTPHHHLYEGKSERRWLLGSMGVLGPTLMQERVGHKNSHLGKMVAGVEGLLHVNTRGGEVVPRDILAEGM